MLTIARKNLITGNKFIILISVFMIGFFGAYGALSILPQDNPEGSVAGISDTKDSPEEEITDSNSPTNSGDESQSSIDANAERSVIPQNSGSFTEQSASSTSNTRGYTTENQESSTSSSSTTATPDTNDTSRTATTKPAEASETEADKDTFLLAPIIDVISKPICTTLCQ